MFSFPVLFHLIQLTTHSYTSRAWYLLQSLFLKGLTIPSSRSKAHNSSRQKTQHFPMLTLTLLPRTMQGKKLQLLCLISIKALHTWHERMQATFSENRPTKPIQWIHSCPERKAELGPTTTLLNTSRTLKYKWGDKNPQLLTSLIMPMKSKRKGRLYKHSSLFW